MQSVIATTPAGMVEAQSTTIKWVEAKILDAERELVTARQAFDALRGGKLRTNSATTLIRKARLRLEFYEKVRQAIDLGYYIIPPFPVQVFAIRTDRAPQDWRSESKRNKLEEKAPGLPIGEGDYVDPQPSLEYSDTEQRKKNDGTGTYPVTFYKNADEFSDVVFPVKACKPEIIEATLKALGEKVFDALGIAPAYRAADPIIVGHIVNRALPRWSDRRTLTFFVAWWLDERDL